MPKSIQLSSAVNLPPFFIWTHADDQVVPAANSLLLAEALQRAGVPVEQHIFERGGHHGFGSSLLLGAAERRDANSAFDLELFESSEEDAGATPVSNTNTNTEIGMGMGMEVSTNTANMGKSADTFLKWGGNGKGGDPLQNLVGRRKREELLKGGRKRDRNGAVSPGLLRWPDLMLSWMEMRGPKWASAAAAARRAAAAAAAAGPAA